MPTSSNLLAIISEQRIADRLSCHFKDLTTHVAVSQTCRALYAAYEDEDWRVILADRGLGKPNEHIHRSWREIAYAIAWHKTLCGACSLTKTKKKYGISSIPPMNTRRAKSTDSFNVIPGLRHYLSGRTSFGAPFALVCLYQGETWRDKVNISDVYACIAEAQRREKDVGKAFTSPRDIDTYKPAYNLVNHVLLGCLFVTTYPLNAVAIVAGPVSANSGGDLSRGRIDVQCSALGNPNGITVLDLMEDVGRRTPSHFPGRCDCTRTKHVKKFEPAFCGIEWVRSSGFFRLKFDMKENHPHSDQEDSCSGDSTISENTL